MALETLYHYDGLFDKGFLEKMFAHKDIKGHYETLKEHSERTLAKANEIISKLQLEPILTNLNNALYGEIENIYPNKDEITENEFDSSMRTLLATIIYLHDIGKVNKKYQAERLGNNLDGVVGFKETHHSAYGHMIINQLLFSAKNGTIFRKVEQLGFCAIALTTIVNRHHTPLLDLTVYPTSNKAYRSRSVWNGYIEQINKNLVGLENVCKQVGLGNFYIETERESQSIYSERVENMGKLPESLFFIYKLWYSILVQADCFATELFFDKTDPKISFIDKNLAEELQAKFHSIKAYNKRLGEKEYFLTSPIEKLRDINELRTRILLEASETLRKHEDKKIFYLDVPTGGGKTNTSIKLALDLVKRKNLARINYVFPFVNIIEQNHEEIEKTLGQTGKNTVSKIYSLSDWGLERESEEENFNLRNQRFLNYPINVVTNVNFFNIFLKSSKKATMKTVELCNSVVILDEIQSLPNKKWIYFVTLLNKISKLYNIYFIIMSATLPDLRLLLNDEEKKEFEAINLLKHSESYARHPLMKRVTYEIKKKANPENEIAEILKIYKTLIAKGKYKKILVVVNTVSNSIEIYKNIAETKGFKVLLLNSATLPYKRKEIIDEIKSGNNAVLVSTQSVEAGVDIDCDVAIRADAPLDSIEQVAGRVNRNGTKPVKSSKVFVVPSKSKKYVYSGDIRNMYDISGINGLDCKTLLVNRDFNSYYRQIMERALQKEEMTKTNKTELLEPMNNLEFDKLRKQDYIESRSFSLFLPVKSELRYFSDHADFITRNNLARNDCLDGNAVWQLYKHSKGNKSINATYLKKIQILVQSFCINLIEVRGANNPWSFMEFVRNSLNFTPEDDESILLADENFVKKYFNENFGLDIQKLKNDFKGARDINFI